MQRGDTGGERNFVSTILVLRETRQPNTFSADQRVQEKMNEYLTKWRSRRWNESAAEKFYCLEVDRVLITL